MVLGQPDEQGFHLTPRDVVAEPRPVGQGHGRSPDRVLGQPQRDTAEDGLSYLNALHSGREAADLSYFASGSNQ